MVTIIQRSLSPSLALHVNYMALLLCLESVVWETQSRRVIVWPYDQSPSLYLGSLLEKLSYINNCPLPICKQSMGWQNC